MLLVLLPVSTSPRPEMAGQRENNQPVTANTSSPFAFAKTTARERCHKPPRLGIDEKLLGMEWNVSQGIAPGDWISDLGLVRIIRVDDVHLLAVRRHWTKYLPHMPRSIDKMSHIQGKGWHAAMRPKYSPFSAARPSTSTIRAQPSAGAQIGSSYFLAHSHYFPPPPSI